VIFPRTGLRSRHCLRWMRSYLRGHHTRSGHGFLHHYVCGPGTAVSGTPFLSRCTSYWTRHAARAWDLHFRRFAGLVLDFHHTGWTTAPACTGPPRCCTCSTPFTRRYRLIATLTSLHHHSGWLRFCVRFVCRFWFIFHIFTLLLDAGAGFEQFSHYTAICFILHLQFILTDLIWFLDLPSSFIHWTHDTFATVDAIHIGPWNTCTFRTQDITPFMPCGLHTVHLGLRSSCTSRTLLDFWFIHAPGRRTTPRLSWICLGHGQDLSAFTAFVSLLGFTFLLCTF